MITVFPAASTHRATPIDLPEVQRPEPGLTVIVDPSRTLPLAGYLLRHDTAVALERVALPPYGYAPYGGLSVPVVPDVAERALEATANAGFDAIVADTYDDGGLEARLRDLADESVTSLVASTARPRRVRRLARAVGAPVLAIPPGAAPAGGPATVDARQSHHVLEAAARVLAASSVASHACWSLLPPPEPCDEISVGATKMSIRPCSPTASPSRPRRRCPARYPSLRSAATPRCCPSTCSPHS